MEQRFVVPERAVSHFHIHPGETVADIGAGTGYFMPALVSAVGEEGVVYALEIQRKLLDTLSDTVNSKGWTQVRPLWGDIEKLEGSKIAANTVDVAVLVNAFFQIEDRDTALAEIARIVRPGGKFFIIDWSESFAGLGPQPEQVVSEEDAIAAVETAGLVYERSIPVGEHHYGIACRVV